MSTLVVGATGYLGGRVSRELAAADKPVAGMFRAGDEEARLEPLRSAGVELVEGDLKDAASLERACQGRTAVVSTASSSIVHQSGDTIQSVDLDGQIRLIEAAKAAGVSRFVYISFSSNMTTDAPLTAAKRSVEEHLEASGLEYTILRCGFLLEVMVSPAVGFDFANGKAVVYGTGENGLSLVSMDDVAKMVVLCLERPDAANATIEFGGPEVVTLHDVVRVFEDVSGRSFEMQHVSQDQLVEQWQNAPDPLSKSLGALMVDYAKGDEIEMGPTLERFHVKLGSVRDYASKVLSA
jgi:NADH dehydrogenase